MTGASGRLGSQLLYELTRRGCSPIAHVRKESDTSYIDRLGLEKRVADLRSEEDIRNLVRGVHAVIHTAAFVSFRGDRFTQFTGINTIAALQLFKAAEKAGVGRFVHVSTIAAVGAAPYADTREPQRLTEESPFNLQRLRVPYILSKRAAEDELLKAVSDVTELVIVNPAMIIGSRGNGEDRKRGAHLVRWPLMPNFRNWMNLVDIRDLAPGIVLALERGRHRERYILGGDDITFRELVLTVSTLVGRAPHLVAPPRALIKGMANVRYLFDLLRGAGKIPIYPDFARLIDYDWAYSSQKARKELGYTFRSFHVTMKDLLQENFVGTPLRPTT